MLAEHAEKCTDLFWAQFWTDNATRQVIRITTDSQNTTTSSCVLTVNCNPNYGTILFYHLHFYQSSYRSAERLHPFTQAPRRMLYSWSVNQATLFACGRRTSNVAPPVMTYIWWLHRWIRNDSWSRDLCCCTGLAPFYSYCTSVFLIKALGKYEWIFMLADGNVIFSSG